MKNIIAIIDLETTGFLNEGGKIVEVGIAGLDLDNSKVLKLYHSVCKEPGMTIKDRNAWIFNNSDLTVEEVRGSPLFEDIKGDIQSIINSCKGITAFNRKFDVDFLRDRGIVIEQLVDCPMLVATDVLKITSTKKWAKGYKWPTVEECWDFFFPDKPYTEKHRGLDDAIHEAAIVYAMWKKGHIIL